MPQQHMSFLRCRNEGLFLAKNVALNLTPALFVVSGLLVVQFWIDIYCRCVEMAKSTVAKGWGDKLFSKIKQFRR